MGNFNRGNRSGGRPNFSRRDFGARAGGRSQMYKAVCGKCGKDCEVPFRPSGDRPVFCSECFDRNGNSDSRRSGGASPGRSNFNDRTMYTAVCDECGESCSVPFQPRSGKPVYCSKCFGGKGGRGGKDEFAQLNAKLDKILSILAPAIPEQTIPEEKIPEKIASPKPKKLIGKTKKVKVKKDIEIIS